MSHECPAACSWSKIVRNGSEAGGSLFEYQPSEVPANAARTLGRRRGDLGLEVGLGEGVVPAQELQVGVDGRWENGDRGQTFVRGDGVAVHGERAVGLAVHGLFSSPWRELSRLGPTLPWLGRASSGPTRAPGTVGLGKVVPGGIPSAPASRPKRLSKLWFSSMISTTWRTGTVAGLSGTLPGPSVAAESAGPGFATVRAPAVRTAATSAREKTSFPGRRGPGILWRCALAARTMTARS